jgi:hypothetical protein
MPPLRRSERLCVVNARIQAQETGSPAETPIASPPGNVYEISCRSTRVGNYRFVPMENVLLNPSGLHISAPHIGKALLKSITVQMLRIHVGACLSQSIRA